MQVMRIIMMCAAIISIHFNMKYEKSPLHSTFSITIEIEVGGIEGVGVRAAAL